MVWIKGLPTETGYYVWREINIFGPSTKPPHSEIARVSKDKEGELQVNFTSEFNESPTRLTGIEIREWLKIPE